MSHLQQVAIMLIDCGAVELLHIGWPVSRFCPCSENPGHPADSVCGKATTKCAKCTKGRGVCGRDEVSHRGAKDTEILLWRNLGPVFPDRATDEHR